MRKLVLALGAALGLLGAARAQEKQDREGDVVTFELKSSIIFAQGTVNGRGPFTFIVDTGASVTVLRPATAEKLGLVGKKDEEPGGLGRLLRGLGSLVGAGVQTATVDSIGMGKALVKDLPVVVMMVPQADLPLGMMGISYDGILGYNYLSQFVTTFDYKKRSIALVPSDYTPEDPTRALRRAPAPPADPGPAVPGAYVGFAYRAAPGGIEVRAVAPDSPAARAGLRPGDLVREVNGERVDSPEAYRRAVKDLKPGGTVTLAVTREGRVERVNLVAAERR